MNHKLLNTSAVRRRYPGERWVTVPDHRNPTWYGPCCYVIQERGVTVYVGSTLDFRNRMTKHNRTIINTMHPHHVKVKVHRGHRYGDWAMREMRLIRKLKPILNRRAY